MEAAVGSGGGLVQAELPGPGGIDREQLTENDATMTEGEISDDEYDMLAANASPKADAPRPNQRSSGRGRIKMIENNLQRKEE